MIEHLNVARSAYFFQRKKRLSGVVIDKLFRALRSNTITPSQNLFCTDRVAYDGTLYSAICFSFARSPAFLDNEARAIERVFGFLMVIEKGDLVAIVKAGLDLPSSFKSEYLDRIHDERVERAIARNDAVFEKLRLKNMSTSKLALHSKTLEARDLENTVSMSSASRFVPQAYRVRRPDGSYSATPSTGRISIRADRAGYQEIVSWAGGIMELLANDEGEISPFIRNFARPLRLSAIPSGVSPTYVAVDAPGLADVLFAVERSIRLVRKEKGGFVEMTKAEIDCLVCEFDRSFAVRPLESGLGIYDPDSLAHIGAIKMGKTRISLSNFMLPSVAGIFVEDLTLQGNSGQDRKSLARYLDREDLFTVLFSDFSLVYIGGVLFRDEALLGGGMNFLRHLHVESELAHTTSEKGCFTNGQHTFSDKSVFRAVVDKIAHGDDVLLCDDLCDEWADFIGINTISRPATVSFYHAKHGDVSLGASAFHASVGQAMKNLGRMSLPSEAMPTKYKSWDAMYCNNKSVTAISRIVRGGERKDIEGKIEEARNAPDLLKRVFIVTSSLSREQVKAAFTAAAGGHPPSAHFVQLYWLLTSYFSACVEIGAIGYVVCQP